MTPPPHTGPPPIEPGGDSPSFNNHIASLLWSLVTFGVPIYYGIYYGTQEQLFWTPRLIWLPGVLAILLIWRNKLHSLVAQAIIFFLTALAMVAFPLVETKSMRRDHRAPEQEAAPVVAEISFESLEEASFSGFRTLPTGERSFVLLTIDEIERQPHRVTFRYSLNEGLVLYRGQGLIYYSTFTLQLADGTIFRYRKEDGIIKLQARNRAGYELSQTSQN